MNNKQRSSAIFDAIDDKNPTQLSSLIQNQAQANQNYRDHNISLLCKAVALENPDLVEVLLRKGANPNTLFWYTKRVASPVRMQGLYFSPLATAVRDENFEIARMLILAGASPSLPMLLTSHRVPHLPNTVKLITTIRDSNPEFVSQVEQFITLNCEVNKQELVSKPNTFSL